MPIFRVLSMKTLFKWIVLFTILYESFFANFKRGNLLRKTHNNRIEENFIFLFFVASHYLALSNIAKKNYSNNVFLTMYNFFVQMRSSIMKYYVKLR